MICTVTYTRRPLRLKLVRPLMIWLLRGEIKSAEAYARMARAGGVLGPHHLADLDRNIEPLRVRLALWERS